MKKKKNDYLQRHTRKYKYLYQKSVLLTLWIEFNIS